MTGLNARALAAESARALMIAGVVIAAGACDTKHQGSSASFDAGVPRKNDGLPRERGEHPDAAPPSATAEDTADARVGVAHDAPSSDMDLADGGGPTPGAVETDAGLASVNDASLPNAGARDADAGNLAPFPDETRDAAAANAGDDVTSDDRDAGSVGPLDAGELSAPNPSCPQRQLNALSSSQTMLLKGHTDALTFSLACDAPGPRVVVSSSHDSPLWSNVVNHQLMSSLLLFAGPAQQVTIPESTLENFEYLEPGRDVWLFSESQRDQMLWPGIQSYEVPIANVPSGMRLELVSHEGPGRVQLYVATPSELRFMLDTDPSHELLSAEIQSEVHMHMSWVFDQPGLYRLRFRAVGELLDGSALTSDVQELRVLVGDSPGELPTSEPAVVVLEQEVLESGAVRLQARRCGEQASALTLRWYEQCLNYNVEPWAMGNWTPIAPDDEEDVSLLSPPNPNPESGVGCQYRAALVDADGIAVSESQAWTFE